MRKHSAWLLTIVLLVSCKAKPPRVDKIVEDGVEVVINHVEPYVLPGVPSTLALEKDFSIDTESEEATAMNLFAMDDFSVDSDGNIYTAQVPKSVDAIFKFDRNGKFQGSFGRKGQGPGEFEWSPSIQVDEENHLIAADSSMEQLYVFGKEGDLIRAIKPVRSWWYLKCLGAGRYLVGWQIRDPAKQVYRYTFGVGDESMSDLKEFHGMELEDGLAAPRYNPVMGGPIMGASTAEIFLGNPNKGYEILVFDLSGKLVRKIRKEFLPVPVSEEYKALVRKLMESRGSRGQMMLNKIYWPSHMPPFRRLFTDPQGRLYIMTNEREGERTYWYDIFTREGIFIGRIKLDNVKINYYEGKRYDDIALRILVKGDRLYCLREKESGFKELVVYKMIWR